MIGVRVGGGITKILGFGAGLEFIYFLDGKDKGQVFSYTFGTINLGFGIKAFGVSAIAANYLGIDSELKSDNYLGTFNYGGGNTPLAGIIYFWGNNFDDPELYPEMGKIWRDDKEYKLTWSGYNITAPEPNASAVVGTAQYIYTISKWYTSTMWITKKIKSNFDIVVFTSIILILLLSNYFTSKKGYLEIQKAYKEEFKGIIISKFHRRGEWIIYKDLVLDNEVKTYITLEFSENAEIGDTIIKLPNSNRGIIKNTGKSIEVKFYDNERLDKLENKN